MKGLIIIDDQGRTLYHRGLIIPLIFQQSGNIINSGILESLKPEFSDFFKNSFENALAGFNTVQSIKIGGQKYFLKSYSFEEENSQEVMFLIEKDNFWKTASADFSSDKYFIENTRVPESENQELRKLFRKLTDLKYALDKSAIVSITDSKGIITYVNEKFCEISKYSRKELLGQNHNIINSHFHSSKFFKEMWRTIGTGNVWEGEIKNMAKDGSFYWMKSTIVPFMNEAGKPEYYLSIRVDITKTKFYEEKIKNINEKLKSNQKLLENRQKDLLQLTAQLKETGYELQKINNEKDKFLSIIAHDLRNPFHSLLSLFDLLENEYEFLEKDEQKEIIINANSSLKNAYKLVENLLNWARLQGEGTTINKSELELKILISESVSLMRESAARKNISIFNKAKSEYKVFADNVMINSVLQNLITNAIKFTPENGTVQIESEAKGSFVEVSVKDSGIGMLQEDLEKLFRIDIHHSTSGTNNEKGSGLGLILCKELIEKNDGEISVSSKPGVGTKFTITLPLMK